MLISPLFILNKIHTEGSITLYLTLTTDDDVDEKNYYQIQGIDDVEEILFSITSLLGINGKIGRDTCEDMEDVPESRRFTILSFWKSIIEGSIISAVMEEGTEFKLYNRGTVGSYKTWYSLDLTFSKDEHRAQFMKWGQEIVQKYLN